MPISVYSVYLCVKERKKRHGPQSVGNLLCCSQSVFLDFTRHMSYHWILLLTCLTFQIITEILKVPDYVLK